mmetsp:Transcript_75018/g.200086  ORF Transcript_75018/g.200086 Transcript_75018/m.200086 type:complete len:251 (-) Transcript_75018:39-791(-)
MLILLRTLDNGIDQPVTLLFVFEMLPGQGYAGVESLRRGAHHVRIGGVPHALHHRADDGVCGRLRHVLVQSLQVLADVLQSQQRGELQRLSAVLHDVQQAGQQLGPALREDVNDRDLGEQRGSSAPRFMVFPLQRLNHCLANNSLYLRRNGIHPALAALVVLSTALGVQSVLKHHAGQLPSGNWPSGCRELNGQLPEERRRVCSLPGLQSALRLRACLWVLTLQQQLRERPLRHGRGSCHPGWILTTTDP